MYGKAGRQRLVPLNPHSKKALDEHLAARSRVLVERKLETRALFFSRSNSSDGAPIDVRSVARMLVQMTKVRRLQRMHPHLLRHACATHMLDNRCPLDVIAEVLGHDNLDTTAHYAQVSTRLMMDSYKAAHPHARG